MSLATFKQGLKKNAGIVGCVYKTTFMLVVLLYMSFIWPGYFWLILLDIT